MLLNILLSFLLFFFNADSDLKNCQKETKHKLLLQSFNSQFQGQHHVDVVSDIFP